MGGTGWTRSEDDSATSMMRAMVRTASTGKRPAAVSPDSMTASVPSKMALATSEASARVGRGLRIIESSISVAVMTGRPARLARSMICFWIAGTRSGPTSTPRSPRATITASVASMIGWSASMASGRSSFAMMGC